MSTAEYTQEDGSIVLVNPGPEDLMAAFRKVLERLGFDPKCMDLAVEREARWAGFYGSHGSGGCGGMSYFFRKTDDGTQVFRVFPVSRERVVGLLLNHGLPK